MPYHYSTCPVSAFTVRYRDAESGENVLALIPPKHPRAIVSGLSPGLSSVANAYFVSSHVV